MSHDERELIVMPKHSPHPTKTYRNKITKIKEFPLFFILLVFALGFSTHLLFTVIFAESKDGQIHACVKRNGEVRIITDYKEYKEGKREKERRDNKEDKDGCRENEKPLVWNIQGPPGPSGSSSGGGGSSLPLICAGCGILDSIGDRLVGKDLTNAVLFDTALQGANLSNTNLSNANLAQSNLDNANLSHANLENTNLKGAQTENTNWSGVTWKNTTCPDGSNSDSNGGNCDNHMTPAEEE